MHWALVLPESLGLLPSSARQPDRPHHSHHPPLVDQPGPRALDRALRTIAQQARPAPGPRAEGTFTRLHRCCHPVCRCCGRRRTRRRHCDHRFGWDGFDQATEWISASLARAWGVTIHDCRRLVISGHNAIAWAESDRGALVIKWSRAVPHFDGLAASTQLLSWLGDRGLPVAVPIRSAGGRRSGRARRSWWAAVGRGAPGAGRRLAGRG